MAAQFACHAVYGGVLPVYLSLPMSATSCICFATRFHSPGVALICLFTISLSVEMSWNWIEWGGWLPLNLNICFWVYLHYELRAVFTKPLIFSATHLLVLLGGPHITAMSLSPVTLDHCNTVPLYHCNTVTHQSNEKVSPQKRGRNSDKSVHLSWDSMACLHFANPTNPSTFNTLQTPFSLQQRQRTKEKEDQAAAVKYVSFGQNVCCRSDVRMQCTSGEVVAPSKSASHLGNRQTAAAPIGLPSKLLTCGFANHNEIKHPPVNLSIANSVVGGSLGWGWRDISGQG